MGIYSPVSMPTLLDFILFGTYERKLLNKKSLNKFLFLRIYQILKKILKKLKLLIKYYLGTNKLLCTTPKWNFCILFFGGRAINWRFSKLSNCEKITDFVCCISFKKKRHLFRYGNFIRWIERFKFWFKVWLVSYTILF